MLGPAIKMICYHNPGSIEILQQQNILHVFLVEF
jgi:hypothetical protein